MKKGNSTDWSDPISNLPETNASDIRQLTQLLHTHMLESSLQRRAVSRQLSLIEKSLSGLGPIISAVRYIKWAAIIAASSLITNAGNDLYRKQFPDHPIVKESKS